MTSQNLLETFSQEKRDMKFQTRQNTAKATVSMDTSKVKSGHSVWNEIIT